MMLTNSSATDVVTSVSMMGNKGTQRKVGRRVSDNPMHSFRAAMAMELRLMGSLIRENVRG